MQKHPRTFLLFGGLLLLSLATCSKESIDTYTCEGTTPTYTASVKAILDKNCALAGCHSTQQAEAGINLSTYAGAKAADGTKILGSIEHKSGSMIIR